MNCYGLPPLEVYFSHAKLDAIAAALLPLTGLQITPSRFQLKMIESGMKGSRPALSARSSTPSLLAAWAPRAAAGTQSPTGSSATSTS